MVQESAAFIWYIANIWKFKNSHLSSIVDTKMLATK